MWHKTEFRTETNQTFSIYKDTDSWFLVMEVTDMNCKYKNVQLFLGKDEVHFLARKLVEMSNDIFPGKKIEKSPDCDGIF